MGAYTDLMVDLETLGVGDNAVIAQIGLVAFDLGGHITSKVGVNIHVDPADAMREGQKADWSTIKWWLVQNEAARQLMANRNGHPLRDALIRVTDFVTENCGPKVRPWGNGSTFDITLLEQAYRLVGRKVPWEFRQVRDLRTLADIEPAYHVNRPRPEREHDALADAMAQTDWAQRLYKAIITRQVVVHQEPPQSISHAGSIGGPSGGPF